MFWGFLMTCIVCNGEDDSPDVGFPGGPDDPPDIVVPDTGDGEDALPRLVVTPESLDFGEVGCDEEAWLTLVFGNEGAAGLFISDLSLEQDAEVFELGPLGTTSLAPGQQTEVEVGFTGCHIGETTGALWVSSDAEPEFEVPLSAMGVGPIIDVQPKEFDFGTTAVGCESAQPLTISNVGNATLVVTDLTFNTGSEDLHVDLQTGLNGELAWSLEPGQSVEILVGYAPGDEYQDISYLLVDSTDPETPSFLATQSGTGVEGQSPDCGD